MRNLVLLLMVLLSSTVSAEEKTLMQILGGIHEPLKARTDDGVLHSLDLSSRTAMIGGYRYHFIPDFGSPPLSVKLYGSDAGSLSLLHPGMKVRVTYGDTGDARVAVRIEQLSDSAKVEF